MRPQPSQPPQNEKINHEFEMFTQLQPSDISYKVREQPKMVHQYILGEILGEGSYAKVREAVDSITSRRVAIKILKKRHLKKIPGGENSVKKEINVLKKLHHQHIVELLEFFTIDEKEKMYIVLEYVGGGTLQGLVERAPDGKLPLRQAQAIFRQLLDGLEFIHNNMVIHGDIKPDNLMFTEDGVLKMSDFGVAEELTDEVDPELLSKSAGSPAFQPPEVASGSDLFSPFKVDVWAAGIVLYIMVIGKYPFSGSNVYTLFESISKAEYAIPDTLDPILVDLLHGILHADPRHRLTIQEIIDHEWVREDIIDEEPFVPVGMGTPGGRINNIFGPDMDTDTGYFATEDDDDARVVTRGDRSSSSVSSISTGTGTGADNGSTSSDNSTPSAKILSRQARQPLGKKMKCIMM